MNLTHKIRLYPNADQIKYFVQACGVTRFTYNWALNTWNEWYREYKEGKRTKVNGFELKKHLNSIKSVQFPWMLEVHRDCTSQPFTNLVRAFTSFFKKKSKYPKFKKKGRRDSFYIANDKLSIVSDKIRIPRLGWVDMAESLRFEGKILSAVVSRTADFWFVSISVETDQPYIVESQDIIGLDLGLNSFATLSDNQQFFAPKPLKKLEVKLKQLHRSVSRKVKGSKNWTKAKIRLSRLYYRIKCLRDDFLHKLSTLLVKRYGAIVIEDLNIKGMMKNHCLAKSISDVAWSEFVRQLWYKSQISGSKIIVADRYFPSSQICSRCGSKQKMTLDKREYICDCGLHIDRDLNAAINLKTLGQRVCGDLVRLKSSRTYKLRSVKQESKNTLLGI